MLCGLLGATPRFRVFTVIYPVSFSLRYLYIRPISRTSVVCSFVRLFVHRSQGDAALRTVVRRADDAAPVRELPYRISVQYSYSYSVSDYGTSTVQYNLSTVQLQITVCFEMG